MNFTTPIAVTCDILRFCSEIDSTHTPVFVPVIPANNVRHGYCLTDVPLFVQKNGGTVQFGWMIRECRKVALEAEFHACLINSANRLIDIVPKKNGEGKILFLPDSQRVYEGRFVSNRQKILVDNEYTRLWLKIEGKRNEIMAKHFRNDEIDSTAATNEYETWLSSLPSQGRPKIGRNDPCLCGSGEKFKRCCGK